MTINFDMDGTIANLYGVDNWLSYLRLEDVKPYIDAKPLINLQLLARLLNRLIKNGNTVNIISWTAKNGSISYNNAVKKAKIDWISKHLASVHFTNIYIIPYGTPKHTIADGILFDDEKLNRDLWGMGAYDETQIFEVLKRL